MSISFVIYKFVSKFYFQSKIKIGGNVCSSAAHSKLNFRKSLYKNSGRNWKRNLLSLRGVHLLYETRYTKNSTLEPREKERES